MDAGALILSARRPSTSSQKARSSGADALRNVFCRPRGTSRSSHIVNSGASDFNAPALECREYVQASIHMEAARCLKVADWQQGGAAYDEDTVVNDEVRRG